MKEISDATWIYLLTELLNERGELECRSQISPFIEDFEDMLEDFRDVADESSEGDQVMEKLKHDVREIDDSHDDAHSALFRLLEAFTFRGPEDARAAVKLGLELLYPNQLAVIKASFAEEVNATEEFAQRLALDGVQSGLDVVRQEVPGIDAWCQRCLQYGHGLGAAMKALQEHKNKVENDSGSRSSELVAALGQARRIWRLFIQTMDFAYPAGSTENDALREKLLGRYIREITA